MQLKYLTNTRSPWRTEYVDYNNVKKIGPESKEKYLYIEKKMEQDQKMVLKDLIMSNTMNIVI